MFSITTFLNKGGFDILVELGMFFFPHAYFALLKFQHRKEGSRKYDGDSDQI